MSIAAHPGIRYAVVSVLALLAILFPLDRIDHSSRSGLPTTPVVVAEIDMPEGAIVDRAAITVVQWAAKTEPAGAYTSVDLVAGRVTRVAIHKGEPIVPGRLVPAGNAALESRITPGKRAYAMRINDSGGFTKLLQSNSRVDILLVKTVGASGGQIEKLFMENMRLLDIRPENPGQRVGSLIATIEVTPTQGERLAIASTQGSLLLTPRGEGAAPTRAEPTPADIDRACESFNRACGSFNGRTVRDALRRSGVRVQLFKHVQPIPLSR